MSANGPMPAAFDEAEATSILDAGGIHGELELIFNEMRDRLRVVAAAEPTSEPVAKIDMKPERGTLKVDAARPAAMILKDAARGLAWQVERAELFADLDLKRNHGTAEPIAV